MLSTTESGQRVAKTSSAHVLVFGAAHAPTAEVAALLETQGSRVSRLDGPGETLATLRRESPALLILVEDPSAGIPGSAELSKAAHGLGIPVLAVVEPESGSQDLPARLEHADDWVARPSLATELPLRASRLVSPRRGGETDRGSPQGLPTDSRFFPLIVHDLRTPLNVIGLSLRMIEQAVPKGNAELEEDLRFVEENFKQIERMLAQLGDYCRLFESETAGPPTEFSPGRLLEEVVANRIVKAGGKAGPVHLDVQDSCPPEASLDPVRAGQAIQYALGNAITAANGGGVRITLRGGPERLVTEVDVDGAPPPSVKSVELRPHLFERLCGTAAERRGMDLAIAARISEMFGGSARLEVLEKGGTKIVLDWPARLPAS